MKRSKNLELRFITEAGEVERYVLNEYGVARLEKYFGVDKMRRKIRHNRIGVLALGGIGYFVLSCLYVNKADKTVTLDPDRTFRKWVKKLGIDLDTAKEDNNEDEN